MRLGSCSVYRKSSFTYFTYYFVFGLWFYLGSNVHEVLQGSFDASLVLGGQLQHALQQLVAQHLLAW